MTPWDVAARSRFVTSDGTALHVVDEGPADAATTLVLVHAWTLDHTSWDRVASSLSRTVRVLRFDHRGHGGSAPAPVGTATIDQLADDLAELIVDRVPTGRIVLAGHSIGGMTMMALAERNPDLIASRVTGAAFVATSSGGLDALTLGLPGPLARAVMRGERVVNARLAKLEHRSLLAKPRLAEPGLRWLLFGPRPRRADVAAAAEQVARVHPASMVGFRTSLRDHSRAAALSVFRDIPTVVLAGGADRLTPAGHSRRIAAELPCAELVIYPGAGHMLPFERGLEVTARIGGLT
ncbi:alpha/beta fold hydrolase [Kutzneria sp. NPDC052558]|uniref:alpha/beta fold hydrolase n=1 Tax=Kutzneria sp. NPDC052558 TaxID=3364121 RepID=UPI0037C96393